MLTRRTPVIIRVDGRAFHTYTRNMPRPFCEHLHDAMVHATSCVASGMQGCQAAYTQSDEASFLLTDYAELTTDAWFDYNQQKLCSIAASMFTLHFNSCLKLILPADIRCAGVAYFDARAFNMPREEVVNYGLWRALDWERNSVMMLGRAHFSHNELENKHIPDIHEMLHTKGINWAKMENWQRNGSWLIPSVAGGWEVKCDITPNYGEINNLLEPRIYPKEPQDDNRNDGADQLCPGQPADGACATDATSGGTAERDAQSTL